MKILIAISKKVGLPDVGLPVGCGASCCLLYYNIAGEAWLVSIIDAQRPKRYL
jgi:hypothetical protein